MAMNQRWRRSQRGRRGSRRASAPAETTIEALTVKLTAIWVNPRASDWPRTESRPASTN